jgi:uncharacterized protein YggE
MDDAEKNAQTMAEQAGLRLAGLEHVSGQSQPRFEYARARMGDAVGSRIDGFPVEPGEIVVSVQVSARFRFARGVGSTSGPPN